MQRRADNNIDKVKQLLTSSGKKNVTYIWSNNLGNRGFIYKVRNVTPFIICGI